MEGHRDELVITSKVFGQMGADRNARGNSRRNIMLAVEASLKRLNTDRLDVYFLHNFDANTPLEESLRALDDLVMQGKIIYAGASNHAAWQVMKSLGITAREGWSRFKVIQPMYNLVKRQAEVELLPMAQSERLAVISYSPLGGGLLTGKYRDAQPAAGRFSESPIYVKRYSSEGMYESANAFATLARAHGFSPAALAVAWVAVHPAITAPIIGARNVEQLADSLASVHVKLTSELYADIAQLTSQPVPATDRTEETRPTVALQAW